MAYTTINKSTDYFNTKLYTGNGGTNAITGVGFQPDFVWLKNRSATAGHQLSDAVRGKSGTNYYSLSSDTTSAEAVQGDNDGLNTLGSDGFTVGYTNSTGWNNNGNNYASWNWKAGGTASSNSDGAITSSVSVNATAGMSIVNFTKTNGEVTVGHGLGKKPSLIIFKPLATANWIVTPTINGSMANNYLLLNATDALGTGGAFSNPTSSVFSISNNIAPNSEHIAYCFADVQGYSKMGSYIGNGNADGTFVYTGFKPAWLMVKRAIGGTGSWAITDNKRDSFNVNDAYLSANNSNTESDFDHADFLSNGIKFRTNNDGWNQNGNTYIYMAFAEAPLVGTNGVTAKAR